MRRRLVFWTIFCLTVISCRQPEKSKEIMEEAMDVYLSSKDSSVKIERSLELTNRALELDGRNIAALTHKTTLLFRKKDIDGLLRTVDELIKLGPEIPSYFAQKALYLELKGDNSNASKYYDSALGKCQKHLKRDSLDLSLLLEYVGLLEAAGDTTSASEILAKMENINFDDSQKEILGLYKNHVHGRAAFSKDVLMRYWTGEIAYDQFETMMEGSKNYPQPEP